MRRIVPLLCVLALGCSPPHASTPRTVLLVSVDTLRADHLGLYGYPRETSPQLDRLAEESAIFEDASSTSPWTLPAHASMLTGLSPRSHRVTSWDRQLSVEIPTLVHLLKTAGFETGAIVSAVWLERNRFGLTRDFDRYLATRPPPDRRSPNRWVTDEALRWIRERDGRPLFLFLHYYDVHSDYASEADYERLFVEPYEGPADGTGWQLLRANLEDEYIELCHEHFDRRKCQFGSASRPLVVDRSVERVRFDAADIRHLESLYDAGVRQMDAELGRLLGGLRSEGRLDGMLLIVTSDHGEEFMDHGRMEHFFSMYQEVLRVPLLIRGPGIPRGVRIAEAVSILDLAPTIVAQLGFDPPDYLEGLDLSPLWSAAPGAPVRKEFDRRLLYGEAAGGLVLDDVVEGVFPIYRSVRRGRFKLVDSSKEARPALYDLLLDPHEQGDIATRRPEIATELAAALRPNPGAEPPGPDRAPLDEEAREELRALGYLLP